jgi:type I restriction enzyme S subunit
VRTVALGEIVADARSGFASGEDIEGGIVQVRMNNVTVEGAFDWSKLRRVPKPKKLDELIVEPNDILFNATNSPELVGKNAVFRKFSEPITFSNHFIRLRVNRRLADSGLVSRWLTDQWRRGTFKSMCRQWVNQASLSRDQLLSLSIPLLPLEEQQRIAAILDQVDDLRRKRRETLERLEWLSWAEFFSRFGEPQRNPNGFTIINFGDLIVDGPTNGLYKPASCYGDGTPILRINNFYNGRIEDIRELRRLQITQVEAQTYALHEADIIINRVNSREYLGKSALVPALLEPTVFESNMMRIRIDRARLDPEFCIALLQTKFIRRQIARRTKDAVNQSSINQVDVRSFRFILPPLELQRAFAARVAEIDKLKARHCAHLAKLDALFASLQHRAFRGEL